MGEAEKEGFEKPKPASFRNEKNFAVKPEGVDKMDSPKSVGLGKFWGTRSWIRGTRWRIKMTR